MLICLILLKGWRSTQVTLYIISVTSGTTYMAVVEIKGK